MDQLIVTKWKDRSLTALLSDGHCRSLTLESGDESLLGNIYIGKVKNVVKNINAAFIDLGGGKTGYFSLAENPVPLYTDELNQLCSFGYSGNSEKKVSPRKLKAGDELLVQVSRDALKTKDPSVTCCLNFPGTYMVLTVGKPQIGFSAKIKDNAWKEKVREELLTHKDERFGLIVRTNGASASMLYPVRAGNPAVYPEPARREERDAFGGHHGRAGVCGADCGVAGGREGRG